MSLGVFLSIGIIGTGGVAHRAAIDTDGFEFADGRSWMTGEALAAIDGARAAGATTILLRDSHPGGLGVLLDKVPDDVRVVRSWPTPLGAMQGVDTPGIDACIMVGHHSGAMSYAGLLSQSISPSSVRDVRSSGVSLTEADLNARVAGHCGIPVVFASGDDAYVAEVEALVPGITTVTTKRAIGLTSTITRTPAAAAQAICAGVEQALGRRGAIAPLTEPVTDLEVEFVERGQAELLALVPGVIRSGPFSVRLPVTDCIAARHWLTFVTNYLPAGIRKY